MEISKKFKDDNDLVCIIYSGKLEWKQKVSRNKLPTVSNFKNAFARCRLQNKDNPLTIKHYKYV